MQTGHDGPRLVEHAEADGTLQIVEEGVDVHFDRIGYWKAISFFFVDDEEEFGELWSKRQRWLVVEIFVVVFVANTVFTRRVHFEAA